MGSPGREDESIRVRARRVLYGVLAEPRLSRAMAQVADLRLPRPVLGAIIAAYVRAFRVEMGEALVPEAGFDTFNAFFTRRLLPGSRPIAAERAVSPADARLVALGQVPRDGRLRDIKGRDYGLAELLGDPERAEALAGGVTATLYLSPRDYHRVHCPADSRVVAWCYIPGKLYPVNPALDPGLGPVFPRNERVAIFLDTPHGPLAVVMVGANNVGRVSLAFAPVVTNQRQPGGRTEPAEPVALRAGDELGAFNLGSTVVLFAALPGLVPCAEVGDFVRVGQALWR